MTQRVQPPYNASWGTHDSIEQQSPTVVNAEGRFAVPSSERLVRYLRDDVCVALRAVLEQFVAQAVACVGQHISHFLRVRL
jgi:hypothetical protein